MTAIVSDNVDEKRRRLLLVATTVAGAAAGAGVAVPFVASWFPSARALAAGAPVEHDVSKIEPGQQIIVEWRGKPVWVLHRTQEMLDRLPGNAPQLVDPDSKVGPPARRTSRASTARSSPRSSSAWASARTWAARPT